MDRLRHWTFAFVSLFVLQWTASSACAAISPANIKKMKDAATDVVQVTIMKASVTKTEVKLGYWRKEVEYEATVADVTRTASGTKQDDAIAIRSYHQGGLLPPGPKNPPMLQKGWAGKVYLNKTENAGQFRIAVHGHSFEAAEADE